MNMMKGYYPVKSKSPAKKSPKKMKAMMKAHMGDVFPKAMPKKRKP